MILKEANKFVPEHTVRKGRNWDREVSRQSLSFATTPHSLSKQQAEEPQWASMWGRDRGFQAIFLAQAKFRTGVEVAVTYSSHG